MILNPVTVKFSRHELEAARRVIELAIKSRATGRARRNALWGAQDSIEIALANLKKEETE
jgi:hypothetical protein